MPSLNDHIKNYHMYHETRFTKVTHAIAIPLFVLSFLMFFSWLHLNIANYWQFNIAWLIACGIAIYYIYLARSVGLLAAILLGLLAWLADWLAGPEPHLISASIFCVLFTFSTTLIYIGHRHEKHHARYPKILYHLSIAPLLLLIDGLAQLGIWKPKD